LWPQTCYESGAPADINGQPEQTKANNLEETYMKRSLLGKFVVLAILFFLISAMGVCAEETVTIVGEMMDDYQFITSDGTVYEIGNTDKGAEMLDAVKEETIRITGTLQKDNDALVINVISYEVVKE
jgi:hypothetical protein